MSGCRQPRQVHIPCSFHRLTWHLETTLTVCREEAVHGAIRSVLSVLSGSEVLRTVNAYYGTSYFQNLNLSMRVCVCASVCMPTLIQFFATPWTAAHQAPLSMKLSRQEYWSGLPFPSGEKNILQTLTVKNVLWSTTKVLKGVLNYCWQSKFWELLYQILFK